MALIGSGVIMLRVLQQKWQHSRRRRNVRVLDDDEIGDDDDSEEAPISGAVEPLRAAAITTQTAVP